MENNTIYYITYDIIVLKENKSAFIVGKCKFCNITKNHYLLDSYNHIENGIIVNINTNIITNIAYINVNGENMKWKGVFKIIKIN